MPHLPVSVVILTRNEQLNIGDCLRSCVWCDDVHVVDSQSTDQTRGIVESTGARVHVHPFAGFGDQRNWAIDHCGCKHRWQFHLDADERFTPPLIEEIAGCVGSSPAGFLAPSKLMFAGVWLRFSAGYPVYQVRLFDSQRLRFADVGHGQREVTDGAIGVLREPYLHLGFSHGITAWLRKHNDYSTREAAEAKTMLASSDDLGWRALLRRGIERRRAMKRISHRMRGRAMMRLAWQHGVQRAFLDGRAGMIYSALIAMYEGWIERKIHGDACEISQSIERTIEAANRGEAISRDGRRMLAAMRFERTAEVPQTAETI